MSTQEVEKGAVLITGGAKRIGRQLALHLAGLEYKVALHYNQSKREANEAAAQIRECGGTCEIFQCNLANEKDTETLVSSVLKKYPDLSTLVNNASLFEKSRLTEETLENFNRHFDINLIAPYTLIRTFAQQCQRGHVINILDTHISQNKTAHFAYLLSKKSLATLTQMAAVELAPNFRVNGVCPGVILPPEGQEEDYLDRLAQKIPLQRKGSPQDVINAIEFLLVNDFITGQIIFADGGEHLL